MEGNSGELRRVSKREEGRREARKSVLRSSSLLS